MVESLIYTYSAENESNGSIPRGSSRYCSHVGEARFQVWWPRFAKDLTDKTLRWMSGKQMKDAEIPLFSRTVPTEVCGQGYT